MLFLTCYYKQKLEFQLFKHKSVAMMLEIKEAFYVFDIWRVRNRKCMRSIFRKIHVKGYIQRRLEFCCLKHTSRIYYQSRYHCLSFQQPFFNTARFKIRYRILKRIRFVKI